MIQILQILFIFGIILRINTPSTTSFDEVGIVDQISDHPGDLHHKMVATFGGTGSSLWQHIASLVKKYMISR